ncbi:ubiquitin-conjugating enzyme [Colletotrichum orchidophilum]|uniref:Ubiquitin-conjugating enzyme n=1 Tax=Colletotrichum orchidophilum TaxID=1209926 RepID=A0A1G4BR48_9PEZI|nr:ubiquitin-conjugating enzyme [Colletotrichum orchidophilum]OHF03833.1 ubiquitin-conjugating enzyme [Colletotrichum orchidophilum]
MPSSCGANMTSLEAHDADHEEDPNHEEFAGQEDNDLSPARVPIIMDDEIGPVTSQAAESVQMNPDFIEFLDKNLNVHMDWPPRHINNDPPSTWIAPQPHNHAHTVVQSPQPVPEVLAHNHGPAFDTAAIASSSQRLLDTSIIPYTKLRSSLSRDIKQDMMGRRNHRQSFSAPQLSPYVHLTPTPLNSQQAHSQISFVPSEGTQQNACAMPGFSSPTPSSEEEETVLRRFIGLMMDRKCPGCDKENILFESRAIFHHAYDILRIQKSSHWLALHSRYVRCLHAKCSIFYCIGCSRIVDDPAMPPTPFRFNNPNSSPWCCAPGRLFHIFALLCGPIAHNANPKVSVYQDSQVEAKLENKNPPKSNSKLKAFIKEEIGIGVRHSDEGPSNGTGYATGRILVHRWSKKPKPDKTPCPRQEHLESSMKLFPSLLAALSAAWPSTSNSSDFDRNPSSLLLVMARRSPLMIRIAQLLRDDSFEHIMRQGRSYHALFDFLHVVAAHPATASLVRGLRIDYTLARTLLPVCFDIGPLPALDTPSNSEDKGKDKGKGKARELYREQGQPKETLKSLASLLSALKVQAESVRRLYRPRPGAVSETLAMCQHICDLAKQLEGEDPDTVMVDATRDTEDDRPSPSQSQSSSSTTAGPPNYKEKRLADALEWLSENKVQEMESDDWLEDYSYLDQLSSSSSGTPEPGRMKKLVMELSMLRTTLPEGIFVRHDSTRLDAMKVLIVGPEGTPYENGLFEFDLFCPLEYPNKPPLMTFKTTGSNRKFNPNLYAHGKVCFSLLNTWEGTTTESWDPKKSTLLQLLVSIQAKIFSPDPAWNEPGQTFSPAASLIYKSEMRADTLVFAMSQWLHQRKAPGAAADLNPWSGVVTRHFALRWRRILKTAALWVAEDPAFSWVAQAELRMFLSGRKSEERFVCAIRRLKGHFAEWATSAEELALLKLDTDEEDMELPLDEPEASPSPDLMYDMDEGVDLPTYIDV